MIHLHFCHFQINIHGPTNPYEISWYGITKISRMRYVVVVSFITNSVLNIT